MAHPLNLFRSTAFGALTLATALPACAAAESSAPHHARPEMRLTVTGSVVAEPDMATVSAGVIAQGTTAQDAMSQQRAQMARAVATLKRAGIAERDIQTSSLNLQPQYAQDRRREDGSYSAPRIVGYQASNQVTAVTRDLGQVGPMLDALVEAGINNINGISFGISTREALMDEARADAMQKLRARASLYAENGGFRLGPLVELNENSYDSRPQPMMRMEASMAMDGPTPVQAGEMTIQVTLNGVYVIQN